MIQQYIDNPELLTNLQPQQRLTVYQEFQKYQDQLKQQKTKAETELQLKQQEQQDLLTQLQELTGKATLPEIQEYITTLQKQLDTSLQEIATVYKEIQQ